MADDALDARRWLGIPPNRQHALQADQIGPLDAIRYRHLRCLDVGERSKDALGLRQQFDLGGRVLLDAPQVLDDERQSGRIRPREDFDFLGRAGAGGNPQYIAVTGPDQIGLGYVRVRPRKQLIFLLHQHPQVLLEPLLQAGRRRVLVVGLDHFPNPLDVALLLYFRKEADIPGQAAGHGGLLPRLEFVNEKDVRQHEGREAGRY